MSLSYKYVAYILNPPKNALEVLSERLKSKGFFNGAEISLSNDEILGTPRLNIVIDGNFTINVYFSSAEYILEEAKETAEDFDCDINYDDYDKEKLIKCQHRFEVISTDDDFDMDYFNHCVSILDELATFDDVFIFDIG